jgi:hypothetical protein
MNNPSMLEPDEDADLVLANLEIIACLSEHLGRYERGDIQDFLYPCVLPPPETIADWKKRFLGIWDACIDGLDPTPDYKRKKTGSYRRHVRPDTTFGPGTVRRESLSGCAVLHRGSPSLRG